MGRVSFEPRYPVVSLREEMIELEKRSQGWITLMPRGPESTDPRFGSTRMVTAEDQATIIRTLYEHGPLDSKQIGRLNGEPEHTAIFYGARALRNLQWDGYVENDWGTYSLTEKGRKVAQEC